jgi:phosphotransferase system enzyme I (PtsI)
VGPVVRLADRLPEPPGDAPADDPVAAWAQASDALAAVAADLEERGRRAGPEARAVLEAQALMARDPDLATEVARNSGTGADLQVMAPMVRSLRDVGVDLGMSHQRAHQLVSS